MSSSSALNINTTCLMGGLSHYRLLQAAAQAKLSETRIGIELGQSDEEFSVGLADRITLSLPLSNELLSLADRISRGIKGEAKVSLEELVYATNTLRLAYHDHSEIFKDPRNLYPALLRQMKSAIETAAKEEHACVVDRAEELVGGMLDDRQTKALDKGWLLLDPARPAKLQFSFQSRFPELVKDVDEDRSVWTMSQDTREVYRQMYTSCCNWVRAIQAQKVCPGNGDVESDSASVNIAQAMSTDVKAVRDAITVHSMRNFEEDWTRKLSETNPNDSRRFSPEELTRRILIGMSETQLGRFALQEFHRLFSKNLIKSSVKKLETLPRSSLSRILTKPLRVLREIGPDEAERVEAIRSLAPFAEEGSQQDAYHDEFDNPDYGFMDLEFPWIPHPQG